MELIAMEFEYASRFEETALPEAAGALIAQERSVWHSGCGHPEGGEDAA